jgi:YidC/Oxa1 family membrane protein insertase
MERNAILATVLVIAILLGYQWYLSRYETPVHEPSRVAAPQASEQRSSAPQPNQQPLSVAPSATRPQAFTPTAQLSLPRKNVTVETPLMRVVLSTEGARVTAWQLKTYKLAN